MRIPMGNFGQGATTAPLQRTRLPGGRDQVGAAVEQAAGQAGAVADGLQRVRISEDEALARAKAANAASAYDIDRNQVIADVGDRLARGEDYTQAGQMYEEGMSKLQPPQVKGLFGASAEAYNGSIENSKRAGLAQVANLANKARRDDGQKQFEIAIDLAGKAAGQPGADIGAINDRLRKSEDFFIQGFGLDKSVTSKAIQNRIDNNWTNQASGRFNATHDDIAGLTALQNDLTSDSGVYADKLDAEKRNAMALKVGSRIDVLQGKADRERDKADVLANRALTQIDQQVSTGVPATMEQWTSWSEPFRDASPELKADFQKRIQDEKEVQSVLRMPIDQQVKEVAQRQAKLASEGGDMHTINNTKRLSAAVDANVKLMTENPLQFLASREAEPVEPLDLTALGDESREGVIAAQLERRAGLVDSLRKTKGDAVQMRVLLPGEAQVLSAALAKQTPAQQVSLFGNLRRLAGTDATYKAIMQQITPDQPVQALAGMIYAEQRNQVVQGAGLSRSAKTANAGDVARLMLVGNAMLDKAKDVKAEDGNPSPFPMPAPKKFDAAFATAVGSAFAGRPAAYGIAVQAVRAYYVGKAAQEGNLEADIDDTTLGEEVTKAVEAVLGAPVSVGGTDVFAPWGMQEDEFRSKLEQAWGGTSADLPAPLSHDFDDYALQQRSGNSYYLIAYGSFVKGKGGNPVVLDLNSLPTQPSVNGAQEWGVDRTRQPTWQEFRDWRGGAGGL